MFIVIEGLDASGKNTITKLVAEELNKLNKIVYHYDKNTMPVVTSDIKNSFECLQKIIYDKVNQSDYNLYSKSFWTTIQASWFDLQYIFGVKPLLESGHVVCSGWYYKFFAKYIYKGVDHKWLRHVFKNIIEPDLVILLDFESVVTVNRRTNFTDTEVGYLDGFDCERKASFIEYQTGLLNISRRLLNNSDRDFH